MDSGNNKASLAISGEDVEQPGNTACPLPVKAKKELQVMNSALGVGEGSLSKTEVTQSLSFEPVVQGHLSPMDGSSRKTGHRDVALAESVLPFGAGQSNEHSKRISGNHSNSKVVAEDVASCHLSQEDHPLVLSLTNSGADADQATAGNGNEQHSGSMLLEKVALQPAGACDPPDQPTLLVSQVNTDAVVDNVTGCLSNPGSSADVIFSNSDQCQKQSQHYSCSSVSHRVQPLGTNAETSESEACDNVMSCSKNSQNTLSATAVTVSSRYLDGATTDDPTLHGAVTYDSASKANDAFADGSVSHSADRETEAGQDSHPVAVVTTGSGSYTSDNTFSCSSVEIHQQTQLATAATYTSASNTSTGTRGDACKEISPQVSVAGMPTVQIKSEPADTGYEHALSASNQRPQHTPSEPSHISKMATRQHGTTALPKRKKRVRITVVRGEWRTTPQASASRTKTNHTARQTPAGLGTVVKMEPQSTSSSSTSLVDSAVPTALYRNAHIKTEPVGHMYLDARPSTSRAEAAPSSSFQHQPDTWSTSSLSSRGRGRGRGQGRGRGRASGSHISRAVPAVVEAEAGTVTNITEESKIRYCAVQLKQLPPDILAAGMVNLRTDPQVASRLSSPVKAGCGLLLLPMSGTRPHIKVANPAAFHPPKRRSKLGPRPWQCEVCEKTFKTASGRCQHRKIHIGIKEHECRFCGKAFMYKSTLTAHHRTHTDERPFVCKLCGAGFRWTNHLTNHLNTHSEVKPFRCEHCDKSFSQKANLLTHLKRHSGVRPHKCPECDAAFFMKHYLATHMRRHSGERPYRCHRCPAAFAHQNTLVAHIRSHNDERPFQCHLCPAAFRQWSHRSTHVRLMHEKPEKEGYTPRKQRIPLNLGPRSVARARKAAAGPASERAEGDISDPSGGEQPSDYDDCASARAKPGPKVKKRKKVETASDSAACGGSEGVPKKRGRKAKDTEVSLSETGGSSCSVEDRKERPRKTNKEPQKGKKRKTKKGKEVLYDASALSAASFLRKRPRGGGQRPWACEQCGRAYKTKSARTQHYKVHAGVREHVCSVCGADFMYKSVLTSHHRFVHQGEKPHVCPVCGKGFGWSSHLAVHLERHYEDRRYRCPVCRKRFSGFYIKKHLDTHSDRRAFACGVCGARYKSKKAVEIHERVHSGCKPYKCDECGQAFPYCSSLTVHKRVHSGEKPFACPRCAAAFSQSTHLRTHMKGVHKVPNPGTCRKRKVLVERVSLSVSVDAPPPAIAAVEDLLLVRKAVGKADSSEKKKKKSGAAKGPGWKPPVRSEGSAAAAKPSSGRPARGGRSVGEFLTSTGTKKSARTGGPLRPDGTPAPGEGRGTERKRKRSLAGPKRKRAQKEEEEEEEEFGDDESEEEDAEEEESSEDGGVRDRRTTVPAAGGIGQNGNVVVKFSFKKGRRQEKRC